MLLDNGAPVSLLYEKPDNKEAKDRWEVGFAISDLGFQARLKKHIYLWGQSFLLVQSFWGLLGVQELKIDFLNAVFKFWSCLKSILFLYNCTFIYSSGDPYLQSKNVENRAKIVSAKNGLLVQKRVTHRFHLDLTDFPLF